MKKLLPEESRMLRALNLEHNTKYKGPQLMEWNTREVKPQAGEKVYFVKDYGVYIAIKEDNK